MKGNIVSVGPIGKAISVIILILGLPMISLSATGLVPAPDLTAVVVGVDNPEGCLRIRTGPSTSAPIIGCAELGSRLRLTGVWSDRWAEIARPIRGWVYGPQIQGPAVPAFVANVVVTPPEVEYVPYPVYPDAYPSYGYWHSPRRHGVYRHLRRAYGHKSYGSPQGGFKYLRNIVRRSLRGHSGHHSRGHSVSRSFHSGGSHARGGGKGGGKHRRGRR